MTKNNTDSGQGPVRSFSCSERAEKLRHTITERWLTNDLAFLRSPFATSLGGVINKALQEARAEALEEAANIAEHIPYFNVRIADALRAKAKEVE